MIAVFKPHDNRIYLVPYTGENYLLLVKHAEEWGTKRRHTPATDAVEELLKTCESVLNIPIPCLVAFLFRPEW